MENRGAWIIAGLALAFVALLMLVMARSLDTKTPIRIDRGGVSPVAAPTATPVTPEEAAAREEAVMRALVARRAPALSARAAAQAFTSEDVPRVQCTFTSATLVHRDTDTAYWRVDYSCADARKPDDLPNLTSVSVRLRLERGRWIAEE